MGMLYFVVFLALVGGFAAFGLRRRKQSRRKLRAHRGDGIDQGNPFA